MKFDEEILEDIKNNVGDKRYQHILRVVNMADQLAIMLGVDRDKAQRAALYHDAAKVSQKLSQDWIKKLDYKQSPEELEIPAILHGHLGAVLAERIYGERDKDVLAAIQYHTTGRAKMSLLEKIIFVADYIEDGRTTAGIDTIREMVFEDFDKGFDEIIKQNLLYLINTNQRVAKDTLELWNERQGQR